MNKEVESYQGELRDLREENQKLKTMIRNLQEQQRKLLTENK
jgi:cell division protein FtsB